MQLRFSKATIYFNGGFLVTFSQKIPPANLKLSTNANAGLIIHIIEGQSQDFKLQTRVLIGSLIIYYQLLSH